MDVEAAFRRYQDFQNYVGWTEADARRVADLADQLQPSFPGLVDDFYAEIERHPEARKALTGGPAQLRRLKGTLLGWLQDLFSGCYDAGYVARRWRAGRRHVEIGLDQVYTNVALSRLRAGLCRALRENGQVAPEHRERALDALHRLLDLDLTLLTEAYETEYRARQQRAERLAMLGKVAGGVAHELRNPLNVVKTSVYYLLHAPNASPDKKAEHLRRIERHVGLADGVITALSNFARLPVPVQSPFSVPLCVQEALEVAPLSETCRLSLHFPGTLSAGLADADQIRIVFANLIRNAQEAMPEGGQLSLCGRQVGEQIEVVVRDTGVGIAPDQLARIMEPLYSTKARGLGLGLAIARAILEKNQGALYAQSTPGQGSTFTVCLKAAPSAAPLPQYPLSKSE